MCVCLSHRISPESHVRSLSFLCILPMSVAQSSSGRLTRSRIAYRREGVFFPIDNALYSIATYNTGLVLYTLSQNGVDKVSRFV